MLPSRKCSSVPLLPGRDLELFERPSYVGGWIKQNYVEGGGRKDEEEEEGYEDEERWFKLWQFMKVGEFSQYFCKLPNVERLVGWLGFIAYQLL